MNVAGNEARNPPQNVMAYTMVPYSNNQLWTIRIAGNGGYYIVPGADRGYALNAYRKGSEWNADLYLLSGNETDAKMSFSEYRRLLSCMCYKLQHVLFNSKGNQPQFQHRILSPQSFGECTGVEYLWS